MTTQTPLRIVLATCATLGMITLSLGIWAFVAPMSFFEVLAPFEPYNRHFLHDAGVLQIGVGVAMLLAAARRSPVEVALGGFIAIPDGQFDGSAILGPVGPQVIVGPVTVTLAGNARGAAAAVTLDQAIDGAVAVHRRLR